MIEKIRIQNFKNFQDTTIEGFKRINLFAGLNNSGKSNLLEAIALSLANHSQIFLLLKALRLGPDLKIDSPEFFFDDFFFNWDKTNKIIIETESQTLTQHEKLLVEINYENNKNIIQQTQTIQTDLFEEHILKYQTKNQNGNILQDFLIKINNQGKVETPSYITYALPLTYFHSATLPKSQNFYNDLTKLFSTTYNTGNLNYFFKALQVIDPNIEDARVVTLNGNNLYLQKKNQKQPIPLYTQGDAILKITDLILRILGQGVKILLIDEIENGLHYTVQKDFWKMLLKIAKEFDVQIFATTHSMEMIQAFAELEEEEEKEEDVIYFELIKNQSGQIIAIDREPNLVYSENFIEAMKEQHIRGER